MCCTRKQVPLQIAWTKTVHSLQRHIMGSTTTHQTPNAIQIILIHLGEYIDEILNPGLTYMAVSRAATIRDLGHTIIIPQKYTNSAIYFRAGLFPADINSYSTVDQYVEENQQTTWVGYLDSQLENRK
jgi:hypothetical protein